MQAVSWFSKEHAKTLEVEFIATLWLCYEVLLGTIKTPQANHGLKDLHIIWQKEYSV